MAPASAKHRPPPVSQDMAIALRRVGLTMHEELAWLRRNRSAAPPAVATVVPGLCRLCGSRLYMEHWFAPLASSSLVFLLQASENRSFASCLRTIQVVADASGASSVVVGRPTEE